MVRDAQTVGIDVSKRWLDVVTLPGGTAWRVGNDAAGWATLCQQVQTTAPPRIVLEATGGYEAGVVDALAAAGVVPVRADPLQVRRFAQSWGQKAKTDRVEARMLAQFGQERHPQPQPVPTATDREARALLTRRRELTRMLAMEQTRGHQAPAVVQASLEAVRTCLRAERGAIDAALAALVARDPALAARVAQLQTVPGIGPYSATVLAVELPELATRPSKQLASLLGVAPFACESGQHQGRRHIRGGRGALRHLLYEVSLSTIRHEPTFAAFYQHLREGPAAKPVKVARIACVRKLVGILHAMVRDGLTWQETEIGQGHFLPAVA